MKKNRLIFLLFIAMISLVACTNGQSEEAILDKNERSSSELPTLKVFYGNDFIEAEIGTSSWTINNSDGTKTSIESDTAGPTELVTGVSTFKASPESTIKLEFSNKPDEVIVNIWEENEQQEQDSTNMEIVLPDLEGVLIYEVIATWEQGTVAYAFSVEVE